MTTGVVCTDGVDGGGEGSKGGELIVMSCV